MTFQSPAGVGIYFLLHLALIQILQSWIPNTYLRPKIKAQIDEELNHDNVVLPERKTPSKPAQSNTTRNFAKRQNKTGGRNAGNKTVIITQNTFEISQGYFDALCIPA